MERLSGIDDRATSTIGSTSTRTSRSRERAGGRSGAGVDDQPLEPCLRCGFALPVRMMGCKGGHCPNCGHPYPHGDCSD